MRILIVEDEKKIADATAASLRREGYSVNVAYDGSEGMIAASTHSYDLLIIDRMLPGMKGIDIVKKLRDQEDGVPIILLTALGTVEDKTHGLDSGADDYIVKPFSINELLARVRAVLRRPPATLESTLTVGDLTLDQHTKQVTRQGKAITLTAKEYALLEYMMKHAGQVLSKDTLIEHVWDFDADILPNNVEAYIKHLRRKIDQPFKKSIIQTVRGFGYRLEP